MLTTPRFAPEDFERLRNEAIDYVTKTLRGGNDEELGKWTLAARALQGPPLRPRHPGTVAGPEGDHARRREGVPRRSTTRAAGLDPRRRRAAVDPAFAEALAKRPRRAAGRRPRRSPQAAPRRRRPKGLEVTIVEKPADATAISLGFPLDVTRRDDDFYALAVANSYLGEHRTFNGKLMQDLRGKRGLNYGDYSYIEDFIQDGLEHLPRAEQPAAAAGLHIWLRPVPPTTAFRPPRRPLGVRPPGPRRHERRPTSRRPARSCSTTASSGCRPSRAGSATRWTPSSPARTW